MVDELLILDAAEGWSPALLVGVAPRAMGICQAAAVVVVALVA